MYIVTLSKSYVDLEFKFDDIEDASKFIGTVLVSEIKKNDEREMVVTIKCVIEEEF